jgi:hypothetical protein
MQFAEACACAAVSAIIGVVDDDLSVALAKITEQLATILKRLDVIEQKVGYEQRKDRASSEVEERYGIPTRGEA